MLNFSDVLPVLERYILERAPSHFGTDNAPETFQDLKKWELETGGLGYAPLPVWNGASEKTIYSRAAINLAGRAWHDATHLIHGLHFAVADELLIGRIQAMEVRDNLGGWGESAALLIEADTIGQTIYHAENGVFPEDQRAFTLAYASRLASERGIVNAYRPVPIYL